MASLRTLLALVAALAASSAGAGSHDDGGGGPAAAVLDERAALEMSQAAIGRTLSDHRLTDQGGNALQLGRLAGKPLLISLIYTSCHHTCPMMTRYLARVVEDARDALGEDSFGVLTVGFDTPVDTPERMRTFASMHGVVDPRWVFASADAATMRALTGELGFTFAASPKGFDHLAQTTVVDARGVIYRQVYGETFEPPALIEPLKQLLWGEKAKASSLEGWINGVRLFCTIYDPAAGRYRFDYSIFIGAVIGIGCLGFVAVFVVRLWRQSGRTRQHA